MSAQPVPSSSPEASTSLNKPQAERTRASSATADGKGKARDDSPAPAGAADDGEGTSAGEGGGKKAKKGKTAAMATKGAGPGKGWRAGRGGGSMGKRLRKKPDIDEPPNKYRDKFMALRDEYDLAIAAKTARASELATTVATLNRIQAENDFLLDAARRSLALRPSLSAALDRSTSPPRAIPPLPQPAAPGKPESPPTETRIAGPVPASGTEPLEGAVAPDDTTRRSKRQRLA